MRNVFLIAALAVCLALPAELLARGKELEEAPDEEIFHIGTGPFFCGIKVGTRKRTQQTFTAPLGEIPRTTCDGTCNQGKPILCPPGCTCVHPPVCMGTHYLVISWDAVMKMVQAMSLQINAKLNVNFSSELTGQITKAMEDEAGDAKAKIGGTGKAKVEGSRKTEEKSRRERGGRAQTSCKIELGSKKCAPAGVLFVIEDSLDLVVTIETFTTKLTVITFVPPSVQRMTFNEAGNTCALGFKRNDKSYAVNCPCRSLEPPKTSGRKAGEGKDDAEKGVFLGGDRGKSHVAVRVREQDCDPGGEPEGYTVLVDGRRVHPRDYKVTAGSLDPSVAVVTVRHGYQPALGATITVTAPSGRRHVAQRPPDRSQVTTRVSVSRGETATTIAVTPRVRTRAPDGTETEHEPGDEPTGQPPGVFVKDDKGFWKELFDGLSGTVGSVALPVATGYLLQAGGSQRGGATVRTAADGTTDIVVPNEAYDRAVDRARTQDPSFGDNDVARSVLTGTGLSIGPGSTGTGGLRIERYYALDGSPFEMRTGSRAVFVVELGEGAPQPDAASVQAPLTTGSGTPGGFLEIRDILPAGPGRMTVEASLAAPPPGEGRFYAAVRVAGRTTQAVPFAMAQGAVRMVALQKVVLEGGMVDIVLTAETGSQAIRGTLRLSGPGVFVPQGGTSLRVDVLGSAAYTVRTSDPGLLRASFEPDEEGGLAETRSTLLASAGIAPSALALDGE